MNWSRGVVEIVVALTVEDSGEAKGGQPVHGCPRQRGGVSSTALRKGAYRHLAGTATLPSPAG